MTRIETIIILCLVLYYALLASIIPNRRLNFQPATTSYLVKQGFEGTGYDNGETWTESGSVVFTINEDYTTTVLDGSQSLDISMTAGNAQTYTGFTAQDEVWVYFMVRPVTIDTSFIKVLASINATTSARLILQVNTGRQLVVSAAGTGATTTDTISTGTTYHIWLHYKKGTGADAQASVGFSTDGVRPTSGSKFAEKTDQPSTDQVNRIVLLSDQPISTQEYIFDKIRVSTSQIGDNPN